MNTLTVAQVGPQGQAGLADIIREARRSATIVLGGGYVTFFNGCIEHVDLGADVSADFITWCSAQNWPIHRLHDGGYFIRPAAQPRVWWRCHRAEYSVEVRTDGTVSYVR